MADIKTKYPSNSSVDLTITLASLASGAAGVYTTGRESTAVDNTTNNDIDHLLSGKITCGTSPTASRQIIVYLYANTSSASGTPTYPAVGTGISGSDSGAVFNSANVLSSAVKPCAVITTDNTSDRPYTFGPISVAMMFGGQLPKFWGVYVAHDSGVNLNSTAGNHKLSYERIQAQTV
jgi:hypothetical protein